MQLHFLIIEINQNELISKLIMSPNSFRGETKQNE